MVNCQSSNLNFKFNRQPWKKVIFLPSTLKNADYINRQLPKRGKNQFPCFLRTHSLDIRRP